MTKLTVRSLIWALQDLPADCLDEEVSVECSRFFGGMAGGVVVGPNDMVQGRVTIYLAGGMVQQEVDRRKEIEAMEEGGAE